ncbi:MAG: hypothetical protein Q8Q09_22745 [Deltaproteobacteria bacterium]|nr:hypothetical protein [Deltaproteobacteria bacterium]
MSLLRARHVLFFAVATAACNTPPAADPCGAPADAEMSDDASSPMAPPACTACSAIAGDALDQQMATQFAGEIAPVVAFNRTASVPIAMPGAMRMSSAGFVLRMAIASGDLDASQTLFRRIEDTLDRTYSDFAARPPLRVIEGMPTEDDTLNPVVELGDRCIAMLRTRGFTADLSLGVRANAQSAAIATVLDDTTGDAVGFQIAEQFNGWRLSQAARFMVACGQLANQRFAVTLGLQLLDASLNTLATSGPNAGAAIDERGQWDTNRQSAMVANAMDIFSLVSPGECATRRDRVESAARWLASRVTPQGAVDSSLSSRTCVTGAADSRELDVSLAYRAVMASAVAFEPMVMDSPLAAAAGRMSAFALQNPGQSTCFP